MKLRIIVIRPLSMPVVEFIDPGLEAMQGVVGGLIERVGLDDDIDLWCNEEGRLLELPLTIVLPGRAPIVPEGWDIIYAEPDAARPGELGEWRIHGDCFVARARDGEVVSLLEADVARWMPVLGAGARAAARRRGL